MPKQRVSVKDWLYNIGLILIAASFIACVLSFYLLVFGVPVFILGAILVLCSKSSMRKKLLTTITPLLLYVPATFLFLYDYKYSTPKVLLIPNTFSGILRVIYAEECSCSYEQTEGKETLNFPDNGILILNEKYDGHFNYEFYFVDSLGNRTGIPHVIDPDDKTQKPPYVLGAGSGTVLQTSLEDSNAEEFEGYSYSEFHVYHQERVDGDAYRINDKLDSMCTAMLKQCRERIKP